jgi:DNA-3-methyladenine glycosylase I
VSGSGPTASIRANGRGKAYRPISDRAEPISSLGTCLGIDGRLRARENPSPAILGAHFGDPPEGGLNPSSETDERRCSWADLDPLLRAYHDEEWGVPERDNRRMWEKLMLDGFQAGLSWIIILRKREAFRKAFQNFEPDQVSRFGEKDVLRLLADPSIVRSRAKIESTISGARAYLAMQSGGDDFSSWVWKIAGGRPIQNHGPVPSETPLSAKLSVELKKRGFRFVGPVIVYAWMQAIGIVNDHAPQCYRRPVVKRMGRGDANSKRIAPTSLGG